MLPQRWNRTICYTALDRFAHLGITHKTAVRAAFQTLLKHCAPQADWTLVPEHAVNPRRGQRTIVDGALLDDFRVAHGYWEAQDDALRHFNENDNGRIICARAWDRAGETGRPGVSAYARCGRGWSGV